jgi:penicillin-binding protein 2
VRLSILGVVTLGLFTALFARLYDLQVVESPELQVQADANRIRTVELPAPRGRILDRNGRVLVDNRVAITVAIDRSELAELSDKQQEQVIGRLSWELTTAGTPTSVEQIKQRLKDRRFSQFAPVPIAQDLPEAFKIFVEEHADEFPAVHVERSAIRHYPFGRLAAHILGYSGPITEEELTFIEAAGTDKPYTLNDQIGRSGVESTFERHLRGTPGRRVLEVDAVGTPVRVIEETPPKPGDDLVLSIDANMQAYAEQVLRQGMEEARARPPRGEGHPNRATTGALVVLDPNNGDVLAMASLPTYDPRTFVDGISTEEWQFLNDPANNQPLNNWAIQGRWAPGSTYKLFTGYATLMSGLRDENTIFNDQGGYLIPGCTGEKCFRSNAGGAAYGPLAFRQALTVSSDAYFYSAGAELWINQGRFGGEEALQQHLFPWGLGQKTGIALTNERTGRVPTAQWRREFCEATNCNDPVWRAGDNVNLAIGQGDVLVTPLQLANGYATLANGGTRYVPQIAVRVDAAETGEPVTTFGPDIGGEVKLPGNVRQALLDGLAGVPHPGGTAARAFAGFPLDQFPIAGKTGTAQVDGKADTAVFSAFGPVNAPKYQVTAVIEEAGFGGTSAAPVVRAMFEVLSGVKPLPELGPGGARPEVGPLVDAPGAVD